MGSPGGSDSKESTLNAGDLGLIPGLGRSPGGAHGNPVQYSCLENSRGQRSLAGCCPWGHKESDTTEWLSTSQKYWGKVLIFMSLAHPCEGRRTSLVSEIGGKTSYSTCPNQAKLYSILSQMYKLQVSIHLMKMIHQWISLTVGVLKSIWTSIIK